MIRKTVYNHLNPKEIQIVTTNFTFKNRNKQSNKMIVEFNEEVELLTKSIENLKQEMISKSTQNLSEVDEISNSD